MGVGADESVNYQLIVVDQSRVRCGAGYPLVHRSSSCGSPSDPTPIQRRLSHRHRSLST